MAVQTGRTTILREWNTWQVCGHVLMHCMLGKGLARDEGGLLPSLLRTLVSSSTTAARFHMQRTDQDLSCPSLAFCLCLCRCTGPAIPTRPHPTPRLATACDCGWEAHSWASPATTALTTQAFISCAVSTVGAGATSGTARVSPSLPVLCTCPPRQARCSRLCRARLECLGSNYCRCAAGNAATCAQLILIQTFRTPLQLSWWSYRCQVLAHQACRGGRTPAIRPPLLTCGHRGPVDRWAWAAAGLLCAAFQAAAALCLFLMSLTATIIRNMPSTLVTEN